MKFPSTYYHGMGNTLAAGTKRFEAVARGKFNDLAQLRHRLSNTNPDYRAEDFEDLLWMVRRVMEVYRLMVEAIGKFAPALDSDHPQCTREHLLAILEMEAAHAQVERLVSHSTSMANEIAADYRDEVATIVSWDNVD